MFDADAAMFLWASGTIFGRDVVPEVCKTSAMSSGVAGVTGFAGPPAPRCEEGLVHMALARRNGRTVHRATHFGAIGRAGVRIAYAAEGRGPALLAPPGWISHLELLWQDPAYRAFIAPLTAAAAVDTIVTELCVFRRRDGRLCLTELLDDATVDDVKAVTTARFSVDEALAVRTA